jgi:hypothetical protein
VDPDRSTQLLTEWQRCAGDDFANHFRQAWTYLSQTLGEVASDDATWTITTHAGHAVLLLAGDTAFALIAFSGPADGVTIKGALHPLLEGMIRVSFSDQLAADEVKIGGLEPFKPTIRQWRFDWHGRLQLPIEYWVPRYWAPTAKAAKETMGIDLLHHERQRAMAHKLARAAGWPMHAEGGGEAG